MDKVASHRHASVEVVKLRRCSLRLLAAKTDKQKQHSRFIRIFSYSLIFFQMRLFVLSLFLENKCVVPAWLTAYLREGDSRSPSKKLDCFCSITVAASPPLLDNIFLSHKCHTPHFNQPMFYCGWGAGMFLVFSQQSKVLRTIRVLVWVGKVCLGCTANHCRCTFFRNWLSNF